VTLVRWGAVIIGREPDFDSAQPPRSRLFMSNIATKPDTLLIRAQHRLTASFQCGAS
jgi:hypothetical protein